MVKKKKLPKIIGLLQEYLKKQIGDNTIVLKELEYEIYALMGGLGSVILYDDESGHKTSIIPILRKERDYWLSLVLSMKGTTSEIDSVSIGVYFGNQTDSEKVKLFRAEWSQNYHQSHAQPHWHLHQSENQGIKNQTWDEEQEATYFTEELSNNLNKKVKKIHFAMAAQWHKTKGSHILDLKGMDDNDVLRWISSTFEYILHQLHYLEDKSEIQ
jgi:uncharacterized FlaG/YvyC family protein